jgi:hypothetical protein
MAFCNSCGATLQSGAKFCPKCGTSQPVSGATPVATASAPATPSQGSGALKIILILVAVVVVLGILGMGTVAFIGWRIAHRTRIQEQNGNVRVETPFGTVESTNNPEQAARNLGIDMYPGARVLKGNTAAMGGTHTVSAEFESDDAADKVAAFYKSKLPNANINVAEQDHYTIVSTDNKNLITINIEPQGSTTHIHIASLSGKMPGTSD